MYMKREVGISGHNGDGSLILIHNTNELKWTDKGCTIRSLPLDQA